MLATELATENLKKLFCAELRKDFKSSLSSSIASLVYDAT